ncbi:MAG TPA: homoserine O-acetyltransferase [Candidatus Limnocylindrales bacterium]|nr:homoserine O-acetyltransferase [Candidatus Limnocylindrales bacterium]
MKTTVFESSDTVRHSRPLRYAQSVTFEQPLELEKGSHLPSVTVAFETYGQLNEARDNAILVCHAISGDSHVAKHDATDDPGWWDIVVGPGKAVDTNKLFVICPNLLGGCRGTTGPGSVNPVTGKPYGRDFPTITVGDMVEVQRRLLDHLGIQQLRAVVGGSLGGHQVLTWAERYPDRVRGIVALATSSRLTTQALAFDVVGRNAILRDPHFYGGQYYDKPQGPDVGLALARMIGHITYLSPQAMQEKFEADRLHPRELAIEFEKKFSVGSYLGYQGTKFVERFDANSYVILSLAMDLFDLGGTREQLAAAFRKAGCRWLVVSFSSDWLFPPDQSREIMHALTANNAAVSYCNVQSSCGHDAFLLPDELQVYGGMIRAFLENFAGAGANPATAADDGPHGPTSIFRQHRVDYDRIAELVPRGASVLDLGCGSGALLARLRQEDHRRLVGVELDEHKILSCISKGLDVIQLDLNKGLGAFASGQFDCVILSQTLQAVYDVEGLLTEMIRIGRTCIVSIPNFAYHPLRKMLAEEGRAPKSGGVLHYEWYNTPNIRFFTIADFEAFCEEKAIRVHRRIALDTETGREVFEDPNRNADLAIFVISRASLPN